MIKLNFKDKWNPPHPENCGPVEYYRKLNGIEADIFYSFDKLIKVKNIKKPDNLWELIEFVGGFTDECFFDAKSINSLTEDDKIEFLKYIKEVKKQ